MKISNPKAITEEKFLPCIKECFKENLKSVIIYGSAASDSFNAAASDINILILLDRNIANSLIEFGKKSKKIVKKYRFSILILTTEEFISSVDVFPMEYYDIHDRHIVICGETIAGKLKLTSCNLRHELEERLRGFSNYFRQAVIQSGGSQRFLKHNIKTAPGMIKTIMRAALRLKGAEVKNLTDAGKIFAEVEKKYEVDMSVFTAAPNALKNQDIISHITKILEAIDKITVQIDKLNTAAGN
ncbi:MAG: nucleotidyltransferase domain-containing protein [Spirochaetes bacterium]|nr:nucleotidyltransferase domain-containing protein [Spirochaetota bacterium]